MLITLKLYASFRPGRVITTELEFPDGTRIADVVSLLKIKEAEIGTIMVNNRHSGLDHLLQDGDRLALFPLIGGG